MAKTPERDDPERDRFAGRLARFTRVGLGLSGAAANMGARTILGGEGAEARNARIAGEALGRLKGPLMKVAQIMATIPDLLPPEFAATFGELQAHAPAMGPPFVRRRLAAELGPTWRERFSEFDLAPAHAASLGQVHRARSLDGARLAVKLQYPDMASAVESDLGQLRVLLGVGRRLVSGIDAREAVEEIAARLREELDYGREAAMMRLFGDHFAARGDIVAPKVRQELCTGRLIAMDWLDGEGLLALKTADQESRNRAARLLFEAWWSPLTRLGVIHGDPHLGNYSFSPGVQGINMLDFGCVRIFPPAFVGGVVRLFHAISAGDREAEAEAYRAWGFTSLTKDLVEVLGLWARFIYGPLLDDRVRSVADGVPPGEYGRREAMAVKRALETRGPVTIPREFVFMDRAAIGLGAAFLHLEARHNWRALFEASLEGFNEQRLAQAQTDALARAGLSD